MARRNHNENSDGKTQRDVNAAQRVILALDFFAQGMTYDEIAVRAGYASRGAAFNAIQRELQRRAYDNVDAARELQGYQIDRALQVVMERILKNDKESLWAVDRLVPLLERKSKLFGLDAKSEMPAGATLVREIGAPLGEL